MWVMIRPLRKTTKNVIVKEDLKERKMGLYIMALARIVMMECKVMGMCCIYSRCN